MDKVEKAYIKRVEELVDEVIFQEDIIKRMTNYIARHSEKTTAMCEKKKTGICNKETCEKCIRKYFEMRCRNGY